MLIELNELIDFLHFIMTGAILIASGLVPKININFFILLFIWTDYHDQSEVSNFLSFSKIRLKFKLFVWTCQPLVKVVMEMDAASQISTVGPASIFAGDRLRRKLSLTKASAIRA